MKEQQSITLRIKDFEQRPVAKTTEPTLLFSAPVISTEPKKVYAIEAKNRRITERIYVRQFSEEGEREGRFLLQRLQRGEKIDWSDETIAGEPLGYVIQQIGGNIPAPLVPPPDMYEQTAVLHGHSLKSLYEYAKRRPNRHGESPIAYIRRRAGLELTTEDVIGGFDIGIKLRWRRIPQEIRLELLERAAIERGKPAKEFEVADFEHEYDFLNGRDMMRVIQQANTDKRRHGQDIVPYILMNAGITRYDPEELIEEFSAHNEIRWAQVPDTTHAELLKRGAEERGKKPYEMTFGEMNKGFEFLTGANLDKQYQYFQDHPERGDKDITEFMFERTGMITVLIDEIKSGQQIEWANVPKGLMRGLLRQAARTEEMAVYKLRDKQLKKRYKFLGGQSLQPLYDYAESAPERGDRDVVEYLFDTVDLSREIIESIKRGGRIDWERVFPSMQRTLITKAAEELNVPIRFLRSSDLKDHAFTYLGGKTLNKLYQHYERSEERIASGQPIIQYMCDRIDAPQITTDEVIGRLLDPQLIEWSRVTNAVKRELVFAAAEEVGKPVGMLTEGDLKRRAYDFLEGKPLKRLYDHAQNHPDRQGQPIIPFLLELIGANSISAEEIGSMIRNDQRVEWARIPNTVKRDLLKYTGKKVYAIEREDLQQSLQFLNGKNLYNMYQYYEDSKPKDGTSVTAFMHESVEMVQEVVADLQDGKPIYWSQMNPAVMRDVLNLFAQHIPSPKPASFIYVQDLVDHKVAIFGDRTLVGLNRFAAKLPETYPGQSHSERLRQYARIPEPTVDDMIAVMDTDSVIMWNQVPKASIRALIFAAARELRKSPYQLNSTDFETPIRLWGDKTIRRLYAFAESLPKRGGYRTVIDHLFFFAGMFEEDFVDTYLADNPAERIGNRRH